MDTQAIYETIINADSFTTDSRETTKNSVFFALKGENFDGNKYAEEAVRKGSVFAVIDNPDYSKDERFIVVDNVLKTLQEVANYHRNQMEAKIIGITGSNGKTTTKTLLYHILSQKYKTLTNIRNYNNHIGVPLTLLNLNKKHELAVIEMGANHPGEIDFLCRIAEPGYGLITNIGKAHLEGFGSFEGVKKTKKELYDFISAHDGIIFYNHDNELLKDIVLNKHCLKISYGKTNEADYQGVIEELNPLLKLRFNEEIISTQLTGKYNFENVLAALCMGSYLEVPLSLMRKALENYTPEDNRSQILKTKSNKIILDAYNANPTSMKAAIDSFVDSDDKNKVLILGDMFELGEYSYEEHKKLFDYIKKLEFDRVYLVGKDFYSVSDKSHETFQTTGDLIEYLYSHTLKDRTILIKGSRGMKLEKITKYL